MSIFIVNHFQSKFFPSPKIGQKFAVLGDFEGINMKDEC